MWVYAVVAVSGVSFLILLLLVAFAEEGVEDETGFRPVLLLSDAIGGCDEIAAASVNPEHSGASRIADEDEAALLHISEDAR